MKIKMINIELPTYRKVIANQVYARNTRYLENLLTNEKLLATQILTLKKFKVPTKDEVINFIRTNAQKIGDASLFPEKSQENKNIFLKLLPELYLQKIINKKNDALQHLRKHYPESSLHEGKKFLEVSYGVLPDDILSIVMNNSIETKEILKKYGRRVYERLIERFGFDRWSLSILLTNEKLPDKSKINFLLENEVRESNVFSVSGDFKDYKIIANQIRLFYNNLDSEKISQLEDNSYQYLEQKTVLTIAGTAECIGKPKTINISNGLDEVIKKIKVPMEKYCKFILN